MTEDKIYEHYLNRFRIKYSGDREFGRGIGIEAKFCLTDSIGEAVRSEQLDGFFRHLEDEGWDLDIDPNLNKPTGARKDFETCPAVISTGTGHCKVEFSVPYGWNLNELKSNFDSMARDAKSYTDHNNIRLLCLGVHPKTPPSEKLVQKKSRHIFWNRAFRTGLVHLFALASDCQAHVDIRPGEVHKAVNVLQGFCGAQIALTANATIWKNRVDNDYLDVREAFWDWWLPDENRSGMASKPFDSLLDYVNKIVSMKPVFVNRNGLPLGIYNYDSFRQYYQSYRDASAISQDGIITKVSPRSTDIDLHDTFNWFDARLSHYCTVENRCNCQQPPGEIMTVPALTLGLIENLEDSYRYISGIDWKILIELRSQAVAKGPMSHAGGIEITMLCKDMLELSRKGLVSRGMGEENYLDPLYERLEKRTCPALKARELFTGQSMDSLLEMCSL